MSNKVIDRLREERDQARDAAIALAEADNFDPNSDSFKELELRSGSLDNQIEHLAKLMDSRQTADALDGRLSRATQQKAERSHQAVETRSLGEQFVDSEIFREYRGRGTSAIFEGEQYRALPTGVSDLLAGGITAAKAAVDVTAPTPPTPLSDAVNTVPVSTNAVEFISWGVKTGAAEVVAEKAEKPPIEYEPQVTADTLDNIAAYTQLTRQMIEDYPSVRAFIDGDLRYQIAKKEEAQIAAAMVAATLPTAEGDDLLAAIRMGMATVQSAGYSPNSVVLNPEDAAELDISVMGVTVGGPVTQNGYWGLRPITASSQPAGTATVGDLRAGVSKFVRQSIGLYVTDSHAETFLSNVFTLLAERRSLANVTRPAALCECGAA